VSHAILAGFGAPVDIDVLCEHRLIPCKVLRKLQASESRVDAVRFEIGQMRTISFQLQPGEVRESVTVTDVAPLITTSRADRGTVVENKFITSIPLNVRNPYLLLATVAGVATGRLAGDNTASQPPPRTSGSTADAGPPARS
jgi:hypothetical protein